MGSRTLDGIPGDSETRIIRGPEMPSRPPNDSCIAIVRGFLIGNWMVHYRQDLGSLTFR